MTLGTHIRIYREEMRLTQNAVGDLTRRSGAAISYYEADKRRPPLEWVRRFARELNLSDDEEASLVEMWTVSSPEPVFNSYAIVERAVADGCAVGLERAFECDPDKLPGPGIVADHIRAAVMESLSDIMEL